MPHAPNSMLFYLYLYNTLQRQLTTGFHSNYESMLHDRTTVHIRLKPHLKAFIISVYGKEPVFFPKKDKLNELLYEVLRKPPKNYKPKLPSPDTLEVILPYFEHLNINTHYYLSRSAQKAIEDKINGRFWLAFEEDMDRKFRMNVNRSVAIALFIEKYELPYTSQVEDMLRKAIYRSNRIFIKHNKRPYKRNKKFVR